MNIIILSSSIKASGGVRQALYLAQALREAGHNTRFLTPSQAEVRRIDPDFPWADYPAGLGELNRTLRGMMPLEPSTGKPQPVIVHAFHNQAVKRLAYLGTLWRLQRLPVACAAHRGVTNKPGNPLPYLLPGIRAFIVNSRETGEMLPLLWRKKRWHFVNNSIPAGRLRVTRGPEEMRALLNIPAGHMVFGDVGQDKEQKGVGRLLEAYAKVRADLPPSTLVVVGVGEAHWKPFCEKLGISEHVRLVNRTEAVADYVQTFDLFVFPSYFVESQPNVIMEAMSLGKPVIGSDIGEVKNMIGADFTFQPGDVDEIAARMRSVGNDPDLLRKAGAQNLAASAAFSTGHRLNSVLGIYQDILREDGII